MKRYIDWLLAIVDVVDALRRLYDLLQPLVG